MRTGQYVNRSVRSPGPTMSPARTTVAPAPNASCTNCSHRTFLLPYGAAAASGPLIGAGTCVGCVSSGNERVKSLYAAVLLTYTYCATLPFSTAAAFTIHCGVVVGKSNTTSHVRPLSASCPFGSLRSPISCSAFGNSPGLVLPRLNNVTVCPRARACSTKCGPMYPVPPNTNTRSGATLTSPPSHATPPTPSFPSPAQVQPAPSPARQSDASCTSRGCALPNRPVAAP